uniref:TSA: Wollemia nobilis Ref_Wollemi_Transcript_12702_2744 transcribed RNA sequence n=1 Tax=Wollemia nobilis TaxID=56998 RepID=A0A0C9QRJ3_9CONI
MTMEVKNNNKPLIDLNKDVSDTVSFKRKRASGYAAYLTSRFASSKGTGPAKKRIKTGGVKCCSCEFKCFSGKATVQNYGNFRRSSLPRRILYFWKDGWNDFPANTVALLKEAFQAEKAVTEVSIDGSSYLVDFLQMVQTDLRNGIQRSIAWIDVNEQFFFPSFSFEGSGCFNCGVSDEGKRACLGSEKAQQIELKVEIGISGTASSKSENCSEVSTTHIKSPKLLSQVSESDSSELEQDSSDTQKPGKAFPLAQPKQGCLDGARDVAVFEASSRPSRYLSTKGSGTHGFGLLGDRLIKLHEDDKEFVSVRNKFLAGLRSLKKFSKVVGIYLVSSSSSSGMARLQAFENHVEITKKFRGDTNVKYAWHGTTQKNVAGIVMHGFGQVKVPKRGAAYGIGVYLAPEDCSHVSAAYSDVDENGEQHMVLCRVIMGNMEQIESGSHQFHPSNEHFDSGVDDVKNPKCYIVWSTHMNTHIHPEYVVSFKVSSEAHEYWAGLRGNYGMHGNNCASMRGHLQERSTNEMARIPQSPVLPKECENKMQRPVEVPVKVPVKVPTSAWLSFPMLFSVIGKHLPPSSMESLTRDYADFKKRKITREELIRRVRMIARDELLIAAIKSIKNQKNGMRDFNKAENIPRSALRCDKFPVKTEFTSFVNETSVTGPSELQDQSLTRPNFTVNTQQHFVKDEFSSHNDQAHY